MNFFPLPCVALPEPPKLRANQGHATSAKRDRFSASSFLKFRIPRVSASRNRGAHFAFPNKIPPFRPLRPLRAKARVSVSRNCGARPGNAGREISGFTLIELMAATTVLSIILLMMVGMQDQMSRAWSNSNRRTDATREARAASHMISSDLSGLFFRQTTDTTYDGSIAIYNRGLPFVYSSNGINLSGLTLPAGIKSDSPFLFGVSTRKSRGSTDPDLAIFGYYIGKTNGTNINGFTNTTYNLYRYLAPPSNTVSILSTFMGGANSAPSTLFSDIAVNSELLARNACNLQIIFYNSQNAGMPVTNGANYRCFSASSSSYYSGSKIHIQFSVYPEDSAQKIPISDWSNPANIQKYARSFEFRVDVPRTVTK